MSDIGVGVAAGKTGFHQRGEGGGYSAPIEIDRSGWNAACAASSIDTGGQGEPSDRDRASMGPGSSRATRARHDMERLFGGKGSWQVWVKVRRGWAERKRLSSAWYSESKCGAGPFQRMPSGFVLHSYRPRTSLIGKPSPSTWSGCDCGARSSSPRSAYAGSSLVSAVLRSWTGKRGLRPRSGRMAGATPIERAVLIAALFPSCGDAAAARRSGMNSCHDLRGYSAALGEGGPIHLFGASASAVARRVTLVILDRTLSGTAGRARTQRCVHCRAGRWRSFHAKTG